MGQTVESHSISAGLDYPGVGPEHAWLHDIGRANYEAVPDAEAMEAFALLCRTEGIIPAIESAHALAGTRRLRPAPAGRRRRPGEPVRARRQGRRYRCALVRVGDGGMTVRTASALTATFSPSEGSGRAALVGYLPAGYPSVDGAASALREMVGGRRRRR